MKKVLIYYGTTEGQTGKISDYIAKHLTALGFAVDLIRADENPWKFDSRAYDGIILGASVHISRFPNTFVDQALRNRAQIRQIPSAFFSVCLGVLEKDNPETQIAERKIISELLAKMKWNPDVVDIFAGALKYSRYGWLKKKILHAIAKKAGQETRTNQDYEYTDWTQVQRFAAKFAEKVIYPDDQPVTVFGTAKISVQKKEQVPEEPKSRTN